jgi:hypothetical protein
LNANKNPGRAVAASKVMIATTATISHKVSAARLNLHQTTVINSKDSKSGSTVTQIWDQLRLGTADF